MNPDRLSQYDYELPPGHIAQHPLPQRDAARLLIVQRATGELAHRAVRDLPELLAPGDCLVFNDTRVIPARVFGVREQTGGKWVGLFLQTDDAGRWQLIGQTRGKLQPGEHIVLHSARSDDADSYRLTLVAKDDEGIWTAEPESTESPVEILNQLGTVPLPPYIERIQTTSEDIERYQTVFAQQPGAVAAPTAGLHFTPELFSMLHERGIETAFLTLHVGIGTFRPIIVENLNEHVMHTEWCRVTQETADQLNRVRASGGRIIPVGTTAVRTLETIHTGEEYRAFAGETNLFIRPPYQFRAIDALMTNFHLPKSSLLVLVSAFLGLQKTLQAYETAVRENYRFFSYGDAMLIV